MIVVDRERSVASLLSKLDRGEFSPSQATRARMIVHMLNTKALQGNKTMEWVYSNTELLAVSDILDFWLYYKDEKQTNEL